MLIITAKACFSVKPYGREVRRLSNLFDWRALNLSMCQCPTRVWLQETDRCRTSHKTNVSSRWDNDFIFLHFERTRIDSPNKRCLNSEKNRTLIDKRISLTLVEDRFRKIDSFLTFHIRGGTGQNFWVRSGPGGWFLKPNWRIYNNLFAKIVTKSNLH